VQAEAEPEIEIQEIEEPAPEAEAESEIEIQAEEALAPETETVAEVSEPIAEPTPPAPVGGLEEDELDDEILEIFLEEAAEEMASLGEYFPKWKQNPDDEEALTTVRRSFHTLKGSGRMVGATNIGEFAWAFESLLNRIIDKTIPLSADALGLIDKGLAALPELIEHFKGGSAPTIDVDGLQDAAHVMSKSGSLPRVETGDMKVPEEGEGPGVIASKESVAATQSALSEEKEEPEEEARGIDPVLLEIFTKESERHLGDVDAFVEQCEGQGEHCRINEDVTRAVHTLHGSAHMAGITDIAEASSLLEKYIKLLQASGSAVEEATTAVMTEFSTAIGQRVSELADPEGSTDYKTPLLEKINKLYEHELELGAGVKAPVAAPEPQQPVEEERFTPPTAALEPETGVEEDFDAELLEIFIEEGVEILDASEVTLQNWINKQDDKELVEQLQREIHTLKGGARMAGIVPMGDLSHSLETMIIAITEGRVQVSKKMFDLVQQSHDKLVTMLEQVRDNQPLNSEGALVAKLEALTAGQSIDELEETVTPVETAEVEAETVAEEAAVEEQEVSEAIAAEAAVEVVAPVEEEAVIIPLMPEQPAVEAEPVERQARGRMQHEQIRVRADLLDELVNFAGEVSIYRSRIEQQVGTFRYNLTEMEQTISRLREQMRRFEIETEAQIMYRFEESGAEYDEDFDPLEMDRFSNMQQLSRALLESLNDLNSIQGLLDNQTRESETLLLQQSRINTELQEGLMRTRMVPFSLHLPRLRRLVRQTSNEIKKDVNLVVSGEEGELDRNVLDRVLPALEHMLRNAVDHGMETRAERKKSGKPETGTIHVAISREGTEVVIRISDDGQGIDLDAIRSKAMERGLMKEDSDLTDKEVLRFILESGFSTAQKVTQISGRGVGMDVVNSEIKQLGGSLQIDTVQGQGSRFTVRLPLTLSVNKALLVNVGEDIYTVPLSSVEGVVRVSHEELEGFYSSKDPRFSYGGNAYRFMHLGTQLGLNQPLLPGPGGKLPVLLARAGDHRIALQVEGLRGSREIVVKPVGPQISSVQSISGATILADGRVALILDVASLVYMDVARPAMQAAETKVAEAVPAAANRPVTVMVVDDSITVRKVTTRLLERNNMHVITAKDGVDAVAVLQEQIPDIFLLDIEMPRMDGYELATHIRNDETLKTIPIIMITSRTGDKHRQRAMDIGVNRYLGKPFQESDLLKNIEETLNESR
jgi:chemosensory pili system protein ChpA (sensor histidine kinase/response regulator)